MSNRDYYGNNVPGQLAGENGPNTSTPMPYYEGPSTQEPWTNNTLNNQYNPPNQKYQMRDTNQPGSLDGPVDGEKGLGATVVGGAGGAFVGHQVGKKSDHGTLGAIGGAVAGAVAANMASNMVKGQNGHGHGLGGLRDRRRERLERRLDRFS
ncbi:hypothetical protein BDW59DRAFT_162502 [Aspergillus cavernicola]|uniref:Glycine zipper 2TM domain-containing protein n=1 Tax=Aspergillus cavernicola TaxID=176166 RepID=A0ABR4I9G6_9EURO